MDAKNAAKNAYVTLDEPAPGSPFHYAFPVRKCPRFAHAFSLASAPTRMLSKFQTTLIRRKTSMAECSAARKGDLRPGGKITVFTVTRSLLTGLAMTIVVR